MNRRWFVNKTNREFLSYLSDELSVSGAFAQVLVNRGIKEPEEIREFISPRLENLRDPLGLKGVGEAVELIRGSTDKKVLVHGDYDVDGVVSTAIMSETLRGLGFEVSWFIPNRFSHGYGFNRAAVDMAHEMGAGLIVTVDCGVTSFETIDYAKEKGIAVIVTDHHEPVIGEGGSPVLPAADVVINPKTDGNGEQERFRTLSGAGVAFKLACALTGDGALSLLDLAAVGTLADVVPLTGENRIIVSEGFKLIKASRRPGLRALMKVSGLEGRDPLRVGLLSFTLLPRINAGGRMGDAGTGVELFTTASEERAAEIAASLDALNKERQKIEEQVLNEALEELDKKGVGPAIVLSGEGWHEGVIGIVASKIAERHFRPTFIFSVKDGVAKGSARSIPSFDLHGGLTLIKDLLLGFGGHKQAAGVRVQAASLGAFEEAISSVVDEKVDDFTPTLKLDADVGLREINFGLVRELDTLQPFGFGNPEPVFGTRGLDALSPRIVGNNHLKMRLRHRSCTVDAIGFGMGGFMEELENSLIVDAAYTPTINEWEGGKVLQLNLKALRPGA